PARVFGCMMSANPRALFLHSSPGKTGILNAIRGIAPQGSEEDYAFTCFVSRSIALNIGIRSGDGGRRQCDYWTGWLRRLLCAVHSAHRYAFSEFDFDSDWDA